MSRTTTPDFEVHNLQPRRQNLRVAVVTETYPPEVNGVALTLARMVQGLGERDHAVQLIRPRQKLDTSPASGSHFHEVLFSGLPVPRYPELRMGMPSTQALVSLWSRQRPDIVHIATEGPLGWSAVRAAQRLKLPTVSDFRTNFHNYSRHYGFAWLRKPIAAYLRKFHNRTHRTTVPTVELSAELRSSGFERLCVIPRGVDARRFSPDHRSQALRDTWGATEETLVIAVVSRLAAEKNLLQLGDIHDAIRRQGVRTKLVFVGDGPLRQELAARSPDAHFAGMRQGLDLSAHYASADLFVFPSQTETFGNVTVEAMASGLPVVAYRHAAAARLIEHRHNGWLAPAGDIKALTQCALEAAGDPALRLACGQRARALAATLDWEKVIDQIEALLRTVVEENQTSPQPISTPDRGAGTRVTPLVGR